MGFFTYWFAREEPHEIQQQRFVEARLAKREANDSAEAKHQAYCEMRERPRQLALKVLTETAELRKCNSGLECDRLSAIADRLDTMANHELTREGVDPSLLGQ